MALPFTEWSREEKDEYARKRMEEMKLKNERYKERYAEVERDRLKAELKNSSITSGKKKEREREDFIPKKAEREWDKGKCNPDNDWKTPRSNNNDFSSRGSGRNYTERRGGKRDEWRREQHSSNVSRNRHSFPSKPDFSSNLHKNESTRHGSYIIHNENYDNYSGRSRSKWTKFSGPGYKSYGNSKLDEATKRIDEMDSASPNYSDPEIDPSKHSLRENYEQGVVWCDADVNEVEHKQIRVEKWIKSINSSQSWEDDSEITKTREYSPQKRKKDPENFREHGFGEDLNDMKDRRRMHTPTEHVLPRSKSKFEQNTHKNMQSHGNKIPNEDKVYSSTNARSERNNRRRNLNDKSGQRRDSEMSDRSSSNKEPDWGKDKYNRATSDSKSSSCSVILQDEECEYVPERKKIEQLSNQCNYKKNKFNKSMNIKLTENLNEGKVGDIVAEHSKCTKHSYDKDKYLSKNLGSSDYENSEYKDRSTRKPNSRKSTSHSYGQNKSQKSKTESKFESRHRGFDDSYQGKSTQNDDLGNYQTDKKSLTKVASPNFLESSKHLESNIPFSGTWADCDQTDVQYEECDDQNQIIVDANKQNLTNKNILSFKNKSNQNHIIKSCFKSSTCDHPKCSIEYQANTQWADYVVSEETEECLSVDSAEKSNEMLIMDPLPDIGPRVKSASFENSNSLDITSAFSKLEVKCITEYSNTCLKTKLDKFHESNTGSCDSYSTGNVTKIVKSTDKKALEYNILQKSECQNHEQLISAEEFQKQDVDCGDEKQNVLNACDPDVMESKCNKGITKAKQLPSNQKQTSPHSIEKLNMQTVSGDAINLSDDGTWSTVNDDEDTDNALDEWH